MQGVAARAAYNFSAAVNLTLTYAYGWRYNHNLGTGGGATQIALNPLDQYQMFYADLNINF